jgi:hypothetical protein
VFGGLLWPIAWIWAYSKPVMHKLAYGHDKLHPDAEDVQIGLHDRLARLEAMGLPEAELQTLRADLDALETRLAKEQEGGH